MIVECQAEPVRAEPIAAGRHDVAAYRSLDELLGYWALKRPHAVALADSEIDARTIGGRTFTFASAEMAVRRLCARFLAEGLRPGDVVALQLPNTVELALSLLATMRAGLVASPVSLVWRKAELLRAFARAPVKAVVTCGVFRQFDYAAAMLKTLAAHTERSGDQPALLFGFGAGAEASGGVLSLDGMLDAEAGAADEGDGPPEVSVRPERPAGEAPEREHPALLSWGFDREFGLIVIPRSRRQLVAAGLIPALELELNETDRILTPYSASSLTGLAGAVAPWLITGASLLLHAPYDHETFMRQIRDQGVTVAVAPAPVLTDLAGRGETFAAGRGALSRVLWVLPSPHSPVPVKPPFTGVSMFMVRNLREYALVVQRWSEGEGAGDKGAIALGAASSAPPGMDGAPLLETRVRSNKAVCELCVGGASAPGDDERFTGGRLRIDPDGFINTGIPCAVDMSNKTLLCLPESDVAYHGGMLIDIRELDRIYGDFPDFLDVAAFTIDDPIMGERIFAAAAPPPGMAAGEPEFRAYLESLEISPVKIPEKLVVVSIIPRDAQGGVLRADILSQI
jgi:mycobactin salicyl-AMP ligase